MTSELNHLSLQQSSSSGSFVSSGATANHSSLHRKTQSNVNLSSLDSNSVVTPSPASSLSTSTRSINHGKPNLAPKPPILNGKPKANPPKRLITNGKVVSRAHSLKSPRSPPVQDPPVESAIKYGTVRNMSSVLSHSIGKTTSLVFLILPSYFTSSLSYFGYPMLDVVFHRFLSYAILAQLSPPFYLFLRIARFLGNPLEINLIVCLS